MIGGYFSPAERSQTEEMWEAYQPMAIIACALMVDHGTIHPELKPGNAVGEPDKNLRIKYDPQLARRVFHENLRRRERKKGGCQMKGYNTSNGYMGYVLGKGYCGGIALAPASLESVLSRSLCKFGVVFKPQVFVPLAYLPSL